MIFERADADVNFYPSRKGFLQDFGRAMNFKYQWQHDQLQLVYDVDTRRSGYMRKFLQDFRNDLLTNGRKTVAQFFNLDTLL
ncbi:hypothetical protein CLOP_g11923, partial [Closterium sp. NIES-67]